MMRSATPGIPRRATMSTLAQLMAMVKPRVDPMRLMVQRSAPPRMALPMSLRSMRNGMRKSLAMIRSSLSPAP